MIAAVCALYLSRAFFACAAAVIVVPAAFSAPARAPVASRPAQPPPVVRSVWTKRPAAPAASRPFLWRLEGAAAPRASYVLGTAHLSHPDVLRLPRAVTAALLSSDVFYNETAIRASASRAAAATRGRAPASGPPLRESLPIDLYQRTDTIIRRLRPGLTIAAFDRSPVWLLSLRLNALIERADAAGRPGVPTLDVALWLLARQAGKRTDGLETSAQHHSAFDWMSPEQQLDLFRSTVRRAETAPEVRREALRRLRETYLSGDLEQMRAVAYGPFERNPNEFNRRLAESVFVRRNVWMADRMERLMRAEPDRTHFFAVGAGHLPGDQGVLRLLAARGLKLTRVTE